MSPMERGFRREREAAKILGTRRIPRAYGLSAPDVEVLQLASGERIQAEVKHRKRLPALLVGALEQALRYEPTAIPMAVVSEYGGQAIACLPLRDLARLLGIVEPETPRKPLAKCKAPPRQQALWEDMT